MSERVIVHTTPEPGTFWYIGRGIASRYTAALRLQEEILNIQRMAVLRHIERAWRADATGVPE